MNRASGRVKQAEKYVMQVPDARDLWVSVCTQAPSPQITRGMECEFRKCWEYRMRCSDVVLSCDMLCIVYIRWQQLLTLGVGVGSGLGNVPRRARQEEREQCAHAKGQAHGCTHGAGEQHHGGNNDIQ